MTLPPSDYPSLDAFWRHVERLLAADRWPDALATIRVFAERSGLPEVRITLGTLLAERGDHHAAIRQWTQVLDDPATSGRLDLLTAVYSNLAATYRTLHDFRLARRFQQLALSLSDDCGPDDLLHLANDAIAAKRYALAESLLAAAQALASPRSPIKIELAATRALLLGLQGDPRGAIRLLWRCFRRHRARADHAAGAQDLRNLAALFEVTGHLRLRRRALQTAEALLDGLGDQRGARAVRRERRPIERCLTAGQFDPRCN